LYIVYLEADGIRPFIFMLHLDPIEDNSPRMSEYLK
jgi:hypothetical protein